jgi:hypothetical protein
MSMLNPLTLEADYAVSVRPTGSDIFQTQDLAWVNQTWEWTGWIYHKWPANVIAADRLIYGFDLRKDKRQLFVLLRILKGGSFSFSTIEEFAETVRGLTGRCPGPWEDVYSQKKWLEIEDRLARKKGKSCTGVCMTFEVVKPVSIPLEGDFPLLGWCNLTLPNYGMQVRSE